MRKVYCDMCGQEIKTPEEIFEYKLPLAVADPTKYNDVIMVYGSKIIDVNMEICTKCKYNLGHTIKELRWKNNLY